MTCTLSQSWRISWHYLLPSYHLGSILKSICTKKHQGPELFCVRARWVFFLWEKQCLIYDFPVEVPYAKLNWPCPLQDEIPGLQLLVKLAAFTSSDVKSELSLPDNFDRWRGQKRAKGWGWIINIHTHSDLIVPNLDSSVLIDWVLVTSNAAMSLHTWRRTAPNGGASLPTVVGIGSCCCCKREKQVKFF